MPITSSAKKALRVSQRRKLENDLVRAKIKDAVKGARLGILNQASDIAEKIQAAQKELDLAVKKNIIHKNKAARLKSRLAKTASISAIAETPAKKTTRTKAATKTKTAKKK